MSEPLAVRHSLDSKNSSGNRRDVVSQAVVRAEFAEYGWWYPVGGSISEYHAAGPLPEKYRSVARSGAVEPVSDPRAALRLRLQAAKRGLISMVEDYAAAGGQANWDCVLAAKAALDKARAESDKP
jgi:hypothetical protein